MAVVDEERIYQILTRVTRRDRKSIRPDQDLASDLDVGSAQALELLATLEDELGVEISEVEAAKLRKVSDVLAFVKTKA